MATCSNMYNFSMHSSNIYSSLHGNMPNSMVAAHRAAFTAAACMTMQQQPR